MQECSHPHEPRHGLEGAPLNGALEEAMSRCQRMNERMTAPRRRVLELLLRSGGPMKAYDLIAKFGENGAAAKPPTVYRALDFLSRQGFAHRIESLNAYMACRFGEETHTAAFLICGCCSETREIEGVAPANLDGAAKAAGYKLSHVTVEARGLCAACQAA
jgi:Fur family zinc uptake transcriptional regulator